MPKKKDKKSVVSDGKKGTRKGVKKQGSNRPTPKKRPATPKKRPPTPKKRPPTPKKRPPTPKKRPSTPKKKRTIPNIPTSTSIAIQKVEIPVEKSDGPPTIAYGHIYSDQCGFCTAMQPEWDKVTANYSSIPLHDIHVVMDDENYPVQDKIDEFNHQYSLHKGQTCLTNKGLPTIFRVRRNVPHSIDYFQDERNYDAISKWLNRP